MARGRGRGKSKSGGKKRASGNTAVVMLSEKDSLLGFEWSEVFATRDLPTGVVNFPPWHRSELVPHLARHKAVNAVSLSGLAPGLTKSALQDAAVSVKLTPGATTPDYFAGLVRSLDFLRLFPETKITWHPVEW
jgi:hypothetical protein